LQPAWESSAAAVYLWYFEETAPLEHRQRLAVVGRGYAAGLVGMPALSGWLPTLTDVTFRLYARALFLQEVHERSPALPLLAIRAARHALAANPDDANAWLVLGQAYLSLSRQTAEGRLGAGFAPLAMLRHIQIVTALEQALVLNPNLEAVHQILALLYGEYQELDSVLEHRKAQLTLVRRAGPLPEEDSDKFRARVEELQQLVDELEKEVQDRQNRFYVRSQTLSDPYKQALLARDLGLPRKALEILLKSQVLLFGPLGAELQIELLLTQGRAEAAGEMLLDEEMKANRSRLGMMTRPARVGTRVGAYQFLNYDWLLLCQAAAVGDYERAEQTLQVMLDEKAREERQWRPVELRRALARAIATEVGLMAQPQPLLLKLRARQERVLFSTDFQRFAFLQNEQGDLRVLAGLLALEQGKTALAEVRLRQALALPRQQSWFEPEFLAQPLAVEILKRVTTNHTNHTKKRHKR
jgi:hypothetical protein